MRKKQFSKTRAEWMSANTVNCQQSDRVARFELALDQWIITGAYEKPLNEFHRGILVAIAKSFESKGSRYHNEVISSTGRDLSNWESFGLLHWMAFAL